MTGFKSTPIRSTTRLSSKVSGAYIVDPYYPRYSTRWGQTYKPDSYRDMKAMAKNFLPWKRPEGRYPAEMGSGC